MGYSGYTEYLCEVGHKSSRDCMEEKPKDCYHCSGKLVWSNSVDTTNGSFCDAPSPWTTETDSEDVEAMTNEEYMALTVCKGCEWCDNGRIDGYVELEKISDAIPCTCRSCGHQHNIEPARYKIPTTKGRRL